MEISSRDNKTFKDLLKLTQKKYRREMGLCVVEGEKLVKERLQTRAGQFGSVVSVWVKKSFEQKMLTKIKESVKHRVIDGLDHMPSIYVLDDKLFDEVSELENSGGVLAVVRTTLEKDRIGLKEVKGKFLVLDGVQDPGNVGTLLRTACAFGFKKIFCIKSADVFSPKVIRSASGVQFGLYISEIPHERFAELFKRELSGSKLLVADFGGTNVGSKEFLNLKNDLSEQGLVLGSEGQGVSKEVLELPHTVVTLPINNAVESLNVAVAGGILMWEIAK